MQRGSEDEIRRQLWVDANVQGAIVTKFCFYWAACLLFVLLPLLWNAIAKDPATDFATHLASIWEKHWPVFLSMCCLLPLTLLDALRLSHRIAGPVLRVRQQLTRINNGEPFSELKFRSNDFWADLALQVNQLTKKTLS